MKDDLINRQDALDAIVNCTNCGDEKTLRAYVAKHNLDNGWTGGILEAIDAIEDLPSAQPEKQHGRIFQEIVVEYPSYNTYPEYKGKPYFSIKYTENGQEFIGYGTYKPEVLSEYLKEYFMPSAQPYTAEEIDKMQRLESAQVEKAYKIGRESVQPEIIRCKDCKYRDENWRRVSVRWLPCIDVRTGSNWYCGSAERRKMRGEQE